MAAHQHWPLTPHVCKSCGSTWFRLPEFRRFEPNDFLSWKHYAANHRLNDVSAIQLAREQAYVGSPQAALVCLCGAVQKPNIGGIPTGRTAEKEIHAFLQDRERAQDRFDSQLQQVMTGKLRCVDFEPLQKEVELLRARLQRYITRHRLQRQLNKVLPVSTRTAAGHGKDKIVSDVQQRGMTIEQARRSVNAVFDIWKQALADHGVVETPVGNLVAVVAPPPRKKRGLGKQVTLFSQNRRIALQDRKNVDEIALSTAMKDSMTTPKSEPSSPAGASASAGTTCPHCGGSHFMQAEFAQFLNGPGPGSGIGGGIVRLTDGHAPILTWVCLCGHPLGPVSRSGSTSRSLSNKALSDFNESMEKARQYRSRQRQQPETWAEQFVDSKTLEIYSNRLDELKQGAGLVASHKTSAKMKTVLKQKQKQTSSQGKK